MTTALPEPSASDIAWHAASVDEVARRLAVDPAKGLTAAEVQDRLARYGANVLAAKKKESGWQAFLRQYRDVMQMVLLGAAIVNQVFTQEISTTLVLLGLTVFNAVLGMNQEAKAEASLAALQQMMKNVARVRRDGDAVEVDASELVPGDIVLVEAGNRVPADGRLFVAATLEIEEAALTGESVASSKTTDATPEPDVPLGDRHCMAFMNTVGHPRPRRADRDRHRHGHRDGPHRRPAQSHRGRQDAAAEAARPVDRDHRRPCRPRVRRDAHLGLASTTRTSTRCSWPASRSRSRRSRPGMPAVVTTLYAMGTRVLASHNAIVKRLPSVETLGSVSAICSDKTGTLTLNKMTAREFTVPGHNHYTVKGEGYSTQGQLLHDGGKEIPLDEIMLPMALCADARLDGEALIGDPTEGALIVLAEKGGIGVDDARERFPRIAEVPFDSEYKFMATFHEMTDAQGRPVVRCFVKGAPDVLIARGAYVWMPDGERVAVTDENRHLALDENDRMAKAGERVMVVARRDFDPATFDRGGDLLALVDDLTLLAMIGIVDPPRPEARDAIAECKSAGIQVRMITGDHAVTAAAIGRELGIEGRALTGAEFADTSDETLRRDLPDIGVIARVAPEDKIRLVHLLQEQQNIVAMTGDGVNDAPALKKADIGVAMGITGTEVSKEAAVMILTDDNFATIVKAVEFGRGIYDNLAKYIRFQMAALVAFILSYLGAAVFTILGGVPFEPLVVLWINFLVQVPIAIALGFDKPSPGLMERKPRPLKQPVLNRAQWTRQIFLGFLVALGTLAVEARYESDSVAVAATLGFVTFALFNVALGLTSRDETGTILRRDLVTDRRQLGLYGMALAVIVLSTELSITQRILDLVPLTGAQWMLCIGCCHRPARRRRGDQVLPAPPRTSESIMRRT